MHIGVLIVDDEEDIRLLMRTLIEAVNVELFVLGEAATGEEAMEQVRELDPQVVVLDERMPGMTGVETATHILRNRPGQRMILCSAYLDDALSESAIAAGVKICISKHEVQEIPELLREVMGTA